MVEGSGTLRATHVAADNLSLGLRGSGALEVAGTARSLRGQFQGTGDVEAAQLAAENATITTNTIGNVALTVNGRPTITAYGLGDGHRSPAAPPAPSDAARARPRCAAAARQISARTASLPARSGGSSSRPSPPSPRSGGASAASR